MRACPLKSFDMMHGNDPWTWLLTIVRHGIYVRCKSSCPSGMGRDDGAVIGRAIDEDGLPACRAVPWLPIPRGLGHAVRAIPFRLVSVEPGIKPAHLGYRMVRTGQSGPSYRRHRR